MSRMTELLTLAAEALEDGRDPLSTAFLDEHRVSFGQCIDLADSLAAGARIIVWIRENPQQARAAVQGAKMEEWLQLMNARAAEKGRQ